MKDIQFADAKQAKTMYILVPYLAQQGQVLNLLEERKEENKDFTVHSKQRNVKLKCYDRSVVRVKMQDF
jgi:hypothetical protein